MRRTLPAAVIVVTGLILLADLLLANPGLDRLAGWVTELLVVLAAGAALLGGIALAVRHGTDIRARRGDRAGSIAVLAGMALVIVLGLFPGSTGVDEPVIRWLVGALVFPLVSTLFALVFLFLLAAARRGATLRSPETRVMLLSAALVVVLLLPLDGAAGDWITEAAGWTLAVPILGVFRGLLIAVGVATAVVAARLLLGVDGADE